MRWNTENVQEGEISKPVPPPWPDGREVCEKEKEDERAAGVVVFSDVIQVSVSVSSDEAFHVADWQFHRPPTTVKLSRESSGE